MILGDKVELEFKEPICFTLSIIPSTHNRPNPALDVPRCHPPRRPYFRGLSTSSLIQPGIAVVSNWKQCDVKRGCSPEARPAVARWELNQPINQSVWPSCWHSLRGVTGGACWHDGRPDSPRPSPRCWLRSQMAPTRAFPAWCAESPRRWAPFISRLSPSERIPLDWNPRARNSGIDSTIPPRRDIDCICRCRDCCATGTSGGEDFYLNK